MIVKDKARRNVFLLIICQALLFVNNTTLVTINALVGYAMAPNLALTTFPVTAYVIGSALASAPIARMMRRYGRKIGFSVGTLFGMLGVCLAAWAVMQKSFWLLCLGTMVVGVYNACGQLYRFAATEVVELSFKEKAISYVMAGGLVGGIVGPNLSKYSKDLLPVTFAGSYAVLIGFALLSLIVIHWIDFPEPTQAEKSGGGRPLSKIMQQPVFLIAVLSATIGYGIMNLLMTSSTLAMQNCGFPFSDAVFCLQWHVIGMFAPSFFTGSLIKRFGVLQVIWAGVGLMMFSVMFAVMGIEWIHFFLSLTLLGLGWNFMFVGGTTLLTESYRPEERNRVQGLNDFFVFVVMATSSFSSGALMTSQGWQILNLSALPFLVMVLLGVLWLLLKRRKASFQPG